MVETQTEWRKSDKCTKTLPLTGSMTNYLQFILIRHKDFYIFLMFKCFNSNLKGIGNNSESVYIRRVVYNAQLHGYRVRNIKKTARVSGKKYQKTARVSGEKYQNKNL